MISTPAIGDIDGDGKNDVVVGALDQHIYAVNGLDGSNKPGWPYWVGDTIFSSPALADLNGDGKLEVIIGADSHQQAVMPPGIGLPSGFGTTPGGLLVVIDLDGGNVPGFPIQYNQTIIQRAGRRRHRRRRPTPRSCSGRGISTPCRRPRIASTRSTVTDTPVTGWPVQVDGQVFTAPALGDIDGDGIVDVVVTDDNTGPSRAFHVYAFKGNGTRLWVSQPKGRLGEAPNAGDPVIADVLAGGPGSGKEVLVPVNFEIAVFNAGGTQLTNSGSGGFSLYAEGVVTGVAVDVSGGVVEIVTSSGDATQTIVAAWKGSGSTTQVPWGMLHRDAAANGRAPNAGTCTPRSVVATKFFNLPPCRVIDTRRTGPLGVLDGPPLVALAQRNFNVLGVCGIPSGAVSISANVTVTNNTSSGELIVFPSDVSRPNSSAISFGAFKTRANNAIVYLTATTSTFSVFNNCIAPVDFVLDVNGYFSQ